MQRFCGCGLFLLLVAGCQGIAGPWAHRDNPTQLDDTSLTIGEQKRVARDRLALPDPSPNVGPNTSTFPTR